MLLNQNTNNNYTARQLKLPLEIEKLIDISDPVYTFCEVMDHIDLSRYFVEKGEVPTRGSGNYASEEAKEIAKLQRELRDTKDALEVLKKAIGILGN